ncbi:MAG: hypothetical protein IKN66_14185 [Ruminococcus sp.]|nr:hypothetical protein [Ruminococcus sp.]
MPNNSFDASQMKLRLDEYISETLPTSQFKTVFNAVAYAQTVAHGPDPDKTTFANGVKDIKQKLGIPVPAEQAPQPEKEVPVGITAGNGIAHEADPLNAAREETVKLVIADMASVNSSIKAGTTRVVKDGEWGKGDNSIDELSKQKGSIFHTMKHDVIDFMAKKADQWNARPENERV